MIGAIWNGISGISTYDKAISVESNNASNANTVGHKLDQISFEDLLYNSGYGKGVSTEQISKSFTQGHIKPTEIELDVAIKGEGFFVVSERKTGDTFYTRAGNFRQSEDGFLETQDSMKVLGLIPQNKLITSSDENDTAFSDEFIKSFVSKDISSENTIYNINTRTTDYKLSALDDEVDKKGNNYKTASSKIRDVEVLASDYIEKLEYFQTNQKADPQVSISQISQIDFSSLLPELVDENDYLTVVINNSVIRENFDTNVETTLKNLSDKISNMEALNSSIDVDSGILTIKGMTPGKEFNLIESNINEQYVPINKIQDAVLGSGLAMVESSREAFKNAVENANAKFLEISNILEYGNDNIIGASDINIRLNALGLVEDVKGEVSISDDGFIYVSSDNNKFLVGKLETVSFKNEEGLEAVGGNNYLATKESGVALNGNSLNTIVSKSLENANVNFGSTLSTLLIYQKAFEANSKSITTSDDFIKTAIDMKK